MARANSGLALRHERWITGCCDARYAARVAERFSATLSQALSWGEGRRRQQPEARVEKDPVCGMGVDPKMAPAKSEYDGKVYYFCAPAWKKQFDANANQHVT